MDDRIGPVILMLVGALPGLLAAIASVVLWRGRRVLEADTIRLWTRLGYAFLGLFCIAAVVVTRDSQQDPALVAFGWIGVPAFLGVLGLWVFAERQRMILDKFPSTRRMHVLSFENRQELRYVTAELSNDLNRSLGAASALQRGQAIGRQVARETEDLEKVQQKLRANIKRCHDLDAKYGLQLRKLKDMVEDPDYERHPLDPALERVLIDLQTNQHELDRTLDKVIDQAVDCRATVNRVLQNITWV